MTLNPLLIILGLTGLTFLIAGYFLYRRPPMNINKVYGYRTKRSMHSQEAWDFAQQHSAMGLLYGGLCCIIIGIAGGFFRLSEIAGTVVAVLILITICAAMMYRTEQALASKF